MMAALYPDGDHVHDAQDIGEEIARTDPTLFEAAMLVETAFRESAFERAAIGPDGRDLCAYQLRDAPRTVLVDLRQCTEIALDRLRYSYHHVPRSPARDLHRRRVRLGRRAPVRSLAHARGDADLPRGDATHERRRYAAIA